jgi:pimeloyl-ACP methyl ester carboxylesterase
MTRTNIVVVLPGIMGSTLGVSLGGAPAAANLIWAPTAGALQRAVTGTHGIRAFTLPDDLGDQGAPDGVEPVSVMHDVHGIPGLWTLIKGYDPLLALLERLGYRYARDGRPGNLLPVPYDWRLSNRYNGQRLATIVESALERWRDQGGRFAEARVDFVCHSMGGLVARWYIEMCGGADITGKLITLGTPWRGAAKTIDQLVNGVTKRIGPIHVDLSGFSRSLPSAYQLLPQYACLESNKGYAKLSEVPLPVLDPARVADATLFHDELAAAEAARPASLESTHMIVGTLQPTLTTARVVGGEAITSESYNGENYYGDGTVPFGAAVGHGLPMNTNRISSRAEGHGNLHRNQSVLDEIETILTASPVVWRGDASLAKLRVGVDELVLAGEDIVVDVAIDGGIQEAILVEVRDAHDVVMASAVPRMRAGRGATTLNGLAPGTYYVRVSGTIPGRVAPVTTPVLVWDTSTDQ